MGIPWYMKDERFEPGTTADVGHSLRLSLRQPKTPKNEWRLYMATRTREIDGCQNGLGTAVKVAVFKKCQTLQDAQSRANSWFAAWRSDLF